jgi:hypothetical protein
MEWIAVALINSVILVMTILFHFSNRKVYSKQKSSKRKPSTGKSETNEQTATSEPGEI